MRAVQIHPADPSQNTGECPATPTDIADLVRRAREAAGLTQHQLAQRMSSTQSIVARWEGGEHEVTMTSLNRIAAALGVQFVLRFGNSEAAE
jgi:ribosome-binding protein aMBF1 (putative translation factor)